MELELIEQVLAGSRYKVVEPILNDVLPVEVKSGLTKPLLGKSLYSFISKYQTQTALILNESFFTSLKVDNAEVYFAYHFSDMAEELLQRRAMATILSRPASEGGRFDKVPQCRRSD